LETNKEHNHNYSFGEISLFFEEINHKLDKLQQYSATDFNEISRNIKNYHNTAKNIYENIQLILSLINDEEKKNYLKKLPTSIKSLLNIKFNIIGSFVLLKEALYSIKDKVVNNQSTAPKFLKFKTQLDTLIENIDSYELEAKEILDQTSTKVKQFVYLIVEDKNKAKKLIPLLEGKIHEYYDNLNKIIISIQFHDIIRQKIDHISIANKEILHELSDFRSLNAEKQRIIETNYVYVIPEILKLQSAILDHTNNECQEAFSTIKNNLSDVLNNISELLNLSTKLTHYQKTNNTHYILDIFEELNSNILLFGSKYDLTNNPILIELIRHDINMTYSDIPDNLLSSLSSDLKEFSDNFKNAFESKTINWELDEISEKLSEAHEKYSARNHKIEDMLHQGSLLNINLTENVKPIIEHISKSVFFSDTINELLANLSSYYEKTAEEFTDILRPNVREKLNFLYSLYSMQSEREIHAKLFADANSIVDANPAQIETDDEVEFF